MIKIFIGGSRHVSRLPPEAKERLHKIITSGFEVMVGDANGVDKAVQTYMADAVYEKVTVYCSGPQPRNNVGHWQIRSVIPAKSVKGFQYYAAKDREMATDADYGLMIWDGKSPGTVLNILRLLRANKKAVLLNVPEQHASTFKLISDWEQFIKNCRTQFVSDLRERATPEEWDIKSNAEIVETTLAS